MQRYANWRTYWESRAPIARPKFLVHRVIPDLRSLPYPERFTAIWAIGFG